MVVLSDAAAKDIEQILDRSVIDFGPHQTELYTHSLKHCLELLGESKKGMAESRARRRLEP